MTSTAGVAQERRRGRGGVRTGSIGAGGDAKATLVALAAVVPVLFGFLVLASRTSPDLWVPVLVIIFVLIVSVPLCFLVTRAPGERKLRWILVAALLLKLAGSFARYYVNEVSYGGEADSGQYHQAGQVFVDNLHNGKFSIEGSGVDGLSDETRFVGYVTGMLFAVVGTTYMGGFLVFTWVCWLGLLLFFQAFRIAYPNAPPTRLALLLFFLPSTVYWPSSIGKDALMVGALGAVTYGIARLLTHRRRLLGIAALVPSAILILNVRPHLLMIVLVGLAASLVARNAAGTKARSAVLGRVLILVMLVPLVIIGMARMDQAFGSTGGGITNTLERTTTQTSIGGSSFETQPVSNPLDFPVAIVSVIFRPFLFEASGVELVAAAEGTLLLAMTVIGGRWLWQVGPAMYRNQFAAYLGGYLLAFVFAFSNIGNAGILARQRVQLFPVLMLLVAATYAHAHGQIGPRTPGDPGSEDTETAGPVPDQARVVAGVRQVERAS